MATITWADKSTGDQFTAADVNQIKTAVNTNADESIQMLVVQSESDLTRFLSGDEYILPSGLVMVNGSVDIGNKAIRMSNNTILRGLSNATITSTNASGVIRATGLTSAVIIREINVVCATGPCYELSGLITSQLNLFFCGMFGARAANITGFDVQSIKQCFISAAEGITFDGTTNKVYLSESPFYGITGAAVKLAATLNASVADIVTNFYKFDSAGKAIEAIAGYTVGEGLIRGNLIDGTAIPLTGLAPSNLNWTMTNNTGIAASRIVGGFALTSSAETTISVINTPVKVAGTTTELTLNERFSSTNNRLTFTGLTPTIGYFNGTYAVDSGNNVALSFYLAKNGAIVAESESRVRIGSGTDERAGAVSGLIAMDTNDYVEIWAENNDSTANLTCLTLNLNVTG